MAWPSIRRNGLDICKSCLIFLKYQKKKLHMIKSTEGLTCGGQQYTEEEELTGWTRHLIFLLSCLHDFVYLCIY